MYGGYLLCPLYPLLLPVMAVGRMGVGAPENRGWEAGEIGGNNATMLTVSRSK